MFLVGCSSMVLLQSKCHLILSSSSYFTNWSAIRSFECNFFHSCHAIMRFDRIGSHYGFCNFNLDLLVDLVRGDRDQLVTTLFPRLDGYVASDIMISLKALKFHSIFLFLGLYAIWAHLCIQRPFSAYQHILERSSYCHRCCLVSSSTNVLTNENDIRSSSMSHYFYTMELTFFCLLMWLYLQDNTKISVWSYLLVYRLYTSRLLEKSLCVQRCHVATLCLLTWPVEKKTFF